MQAGITRAAAIVATISGTAIGQSADWNNALGGDWNTASNWTPGVVPNGSTFDATLGLGGAYTVDYNFNGSLNTLSVTNPMATLNIASSRVLTISGGSMFNAGSVVVNPTGTVFDSRIIFTNSTAISGAGEIVLGSSSETGSNADARLQIDGAFDVTIGADQVVRGNGEMRGGTFVNLGTIRSEDPLGPGILITSVIDQSGGGEIDLAGGVVWFEDNSFLVGGEINGSSTGVLRMSGSPANIDDVTLNMPMEVIGGNDQLIMFGPIVNNSTITLNPNLTVFNAQLLFGADTSITGNGQIVMQVATNSNDAQLAASAGFTGTIGAGQTVSGAGQINGDIVLNGSITATDPVFDMLVNDTLSGPGTLSAGPGARLMFSSADISGVTLESTGDGIVGPLDGLTTVSDITITGNAGMAGSNTRMGLLGDITNNGTLTLNFTNQVFNAVLDFDATATINGTGDIRMLTSGNINDAQIVTSDSFVGTFSAGQYIAGSGLINGTFVNNGLIDGDDPTQVLRLSGSITGSGALFSNGGTITLENVDVSDHAIGTSAGGIITASQGTNALTDVINNGELGLDGSNTRLNINGSFTNNGNVLVNVTDTVFNAVLGVNTESTIDGTGTVVLETSGSLGDARIDADDGINATFGSGQAISGSGQVFGDVTIEGSLDPAGDLREINAQSGTLAVTGTTIFDLGGLANTEFDRITTGANQIISLGGSIEVNLDDGYSPMFGDEWEIIGGASSTVINGSYDSYSLPAAPISLAYRVFIESDRVYVRLTCAADFNGDAMNNFFDISTFIDLFNNGDPRADLTAPFGALNFFDIATYIAIYNAGCN